MNITKSVITSVLIKKLGLLVFFLCSFAYANINQTATKATTSNHSVLILETSLVQQVKSKQHQSNHSPTAHARKASPRLRLSKYLDSSAIQEMSGLFDQLNTSETDLKIAVGVQATVDKDEWEITDPNAGLGTEEETLEPYAGEFTPNTEEENNIILASMLIIFTGAAIIAILSYI
jgi:hypothetical protein